MKVNALYVRSGKGNSTFMELFIEHCKALASQNVQIAISYLGIPAILAKKRSGHNVLIVEHYAIADDMDNAKIAMEKFVRKIPKMPVFVLCGNGTNAESALTEFGAFAGNMFFCDQDPDMDVIYEKIQNCLV